ncbi:protein CLT2, chloroplastic isoform X1 [Citrus sinensis]|uniref:protein CLT2, chloroplastic isoform X1 n=1 Tax=Citrus clementina TaxID=85681 RepID=UPI000CED0BD5|nr:protein CLT2, chloroplastic isoform X1 [Citrus x clementina]XP_052298142.1 protein CLT2, chloroplastic isoform X1 [Citrus sinensis]
MEIISTSWFQAISSKPPLLKRRSHNFYGAKSRSLISMPVDGLPPCRSPTNKYNFARGITNILYSSRRNANFTARASTDGNPPKTASPSSSNSQIIIISSAVTVTLAIANRVLYKLALVPMKQYPFFLAQITTFGYVVIYFSILYTRYLMGIVTDEMISLPKYRFLFIGMLEALGVASGMAAAAMLPGPAIPILSQTFLVWQLGFSAVLLGKKFSVTQIAGCLLVATGVGVAVASGSNSGQMLSRVDFLWPSMMIASSAFQAGASIIKEFIFDDAKKCLKGKSLDIFVVNSFGSGFQALFVLLFLPFLSNLKGIPFAELPLYLKSGAGCLLNLGANTSVASGCNGAPLLPLLYIATNMAFNISMLRLMKISSAVVSSLVVMLSVPIAIYVLSLPLPYLPEGASLSPFFLFGSVILLLGLTLYNLPQPAKRSSKMT